MLRYNRKNILLFFLLFITTPSFVAQELFPLNEPASNTPKGVLGLRVMGESFKEVKQFRNQFSLRAMYGILPRLSLTVTVGMSNHHDKNFPPNLVSHTHNGKETVYTTGDFQRGLNYPYRSNGIYLFMKYRFISRDGTHRHFRMAAYAEGAYVQQAHDEAEPNLMGDTKGVGAGLITTYLKNHFAVSLTSGFIVPGAYTGLSPDVSGGPMIPTEIKYGRALAYNLSMGYLLFPRVYKDYDQLNVNVYLELLGRSYEAAKVTQYGNVSIPINTPLLDKGHYIDAAPGVQCIFKSNLRLDFSVKLPMINKSYAHFYPVFTVGVQRYFYFKKRK
ncbi:MAG TPA: hypothetical protein VFF27_02355 [Bacteroidia bacterium]|jgi:hypothetical protein|nr:hypothetical protein [Bacteroidia bacterium]